MKTIELAFPIKAVPKGRPRLSKWGGVFTPKETRAFEDAIKMMAKSQYRGAPVLCPLLVMMEFVFKSPKKPTKPYPRGDLDNFIKAVGDALNGIVYVDDTQIVGISAFKRYGFEDKIVMTIIPASSEARPDPIKQAAHRLNSGVSP